MENDTQTTDPRPLLPLHKVIKLPDDLDDGVQIENDQFATVDLSTIPLGLKLHVGGDDIPSATLTREGDSILAQIEDSFYTKLWEHTYHAKVFATAMVNAAKIMIADGHSLSNPELDAEEGDHIFVRWALRFPLTTAALDLLAAITSSVDAVRNGAEELLP